MASITAIASDFFAACETGKGWEACKTFCDPNSTFAAQAEPLAGINTLAEYTVWIRAAVALGQQSAKQARGRSSPIANQTTAH